MRWCCLLVPSDQLTALQQALDDLPYALGRPALKAVIRQTPEDFRVDENLGFLPSGEDEHIYLQVQKRGLTTPALVQHISEVTGIPVRHISYAGLKDKYAVTTQWLSLHSPGKEPEGLHRIDNEAIRVLECHRNHKKLRRGAHAGNRFSLTLRALQLADDTSAEIGLPAALKDLESRLQHITAQGVPNYVGEQRFGHDNLRQALLPETGRTVRRQKRQQRSMQISAIRSALFNLVLAERVSAQTWDQWLPGDMMNLDGSGSVFSDSQEMDKNQLQDRVALMDVHPTGPLWGKGSPATTAEAAMLELQVAERWSILRDYLENPALGLAQQRRSLRLPVQALHYRLHEDLSLSFELPVGAFATVVVRELLQAMSQTD